MSRCWKARSRNATPPRPAGARLRSRRARRSSGRLRPTAPSASPDRAARCRPRGPFRGMEQSEIVAQIARAIEANRVDLFLQPIVTLPQRKVRYYEALARLRDDDGSLISPDDFLGHARRQRADAGDRQSDGVPLRAGGAAALDQEPRGRPVLQHVGRNARERDRVPGDHGFPRGQPRARALSGVRVRAERGARDGADRAGMPCRRSPISASASRWIT